MNKPQILTLPDEPPLGAIVELLDGANKGDRYKHDSPGGVGWRRLGRISPGDDPYNWSEIWWAVTEDGGGGTAVRVTIPDLTDPHPTPWTTHGDWIQDAHGDVVPLDYIASRINGS